MYCRCRHQVALSFLSARANFNCDVIITSVSHFAQWLALPVPPLLNIYTLLRTLNSASADTQYELTQNDDKNNYN